MALLQNRSQRASFLVKHIGATAVAAEAGHLRSVLGIRNVSLLLPFTAPGYGKTSSTPVGYVPGNSIFPPMKSGGMGVSLGYIEGSGSISNADLINALRLIVAALTGSGNITSADGVLGLPGSATLTGTGNITDAALLLVLNALADLVGSGGVTDANLSGSLSATADLTGSGDLAADIYAIARLLADLVGSGTISSAQPYGTGTMSADITSAGGLLDTSNVGAAVWGALAAANNDAGTMGEKLNDAGSASNPWTEVIESGYTAAEILRLLVAHAAGAATGLESGTPTFKSLDGSKDRIAGTYTDGDRGITGLDAS